VAGALRPPSRTPRPESSGWTRRRDCIGPAIDRSTIDRARNGDRDAFELIVRARKDAVYRLSFAILGNEADARDAAQESLVAAWRQLRALREPERFDAWLKRIVVNAARQVMRASRRRGVREVPASRIASIAGRAAPGTRDDAAILDVALAALPVEQRSILVLHHLEGHALAELAEVLAIPVGTAKSRLFTARRSLAAAIAAEEGG
jgi:RNA polymerase sigma-70 factor, ECF subfamily